MTRARVINVHEASWDAIVSQCDAYDFYHTRTYHALETYGSDNRALMFVSYMDTRYIALPMVVRKIEGTGYFDCTSVYGYCGAVSNVTMGTISEALINNFQIELMEFFRNKDDES